MSDLAAAKATIARALLDVGSEPTDAALGRIHLRDDQIEAVERIRRIIGERGGALLADPVGLGKTYVALAVARDYQRPLVIAPAALRDMWTRASGRASRPITFATTESLSRAEVDVRGSPDLVIVDEAHHFRTPNARRYRRLASLCASARVLLVSATPVQNRREDVVAQLALFLGSRASTLTGPEVAELTIRRVASDGGLPVIDGPTPLHPAADDDVLEAIEALPTPVPAADEGVSGALALYSLVHLWASSRRALTASLERRRARAHAMREALLGGRRPTRRDLSAWSFEDGALQLAFTEIVVDDRATTDDPGPVARMDEYIAAVSRLLARLRCDDSDPDERRARVLRALMRRHHGERIIAFTQFAETVSALSDRLRDVAGVAAMTATGGRIASGNIARVDLIRQFDASDVAATRTPAIERVNLLITTDVLSEGVNLHAASVVVHLDFPWNPARLEQRVGRVRRLGSPHEIVRVYAMMPPASADRMLRLERRLRDKLQTAADTVGEIRFALPSPRADGKRSPPEVVEELRAIARRWLAGSDGASPAVVTARGSGEAMLALVKLPDGPRLLGRLAGILTDDPAIVLDAARVVDGATIAESTADRRFTEEVQLWLERQRAGSLAAPRPPGFRRSRLHARGRIDRALRAAPRHQRARMYSLAQAALSTLERDLSAGAEVVLDDLLRAPIADEAWLRAVAEFGSLHNERPPGGDARMVVEIVVVPKHSPVRLIAPLQEETAEKAETAEARPFFQPFPLVLQQLESSAISPASSWKRSSSACRSDRNTHRPPAL